MKPLSYSAYSALRKCGEFYRLSYVDRAPTPSKVHFEFGSAMHAGINTSLETQDLEQAFDVFDAYWSSCESRLDFAGERLGHLAHQHLGHRLIGFFHKRLTSKMKLIVGEKRLYREWNSITRDTDSGTIINLEGTPDALVEWEGKHVLLDFKTSAYNYQPEKTDISLQLNLYAWLLEQNGYKVDGLAYVVFNKMTEGLQTPYIVQYKSDYALTLIRDMVHYYERNAGFYEKNPLACVIGKQICEFYQRCHAKQEDSNQSEPEEAEADAGVR